MDGPPPTVADLLARDHRRLDDLLGRFFSAADRESAARAIADFDAALRAHTRLEEEHLFGAVPGGKLMALPDESERNRLFRELTLEHVQIRELSGMIVRKLSEASDDGGVFALAGSLARRWDAHTAREESECHRFSGGSLDPSQETALRKALEPES